VARRPGLFLFSALGSRGIAWAELGAQVLAAQISGAPVPLEASLVDALDPARFALRAARRAGRRS
jgi:tRNA 5-methylaminomethyl-2-thiouridine biosynthesis bifunctional protein